MNKHRLSSSYLTNDYLTVTACRPAALGVLHTEVFQCCTADALFVGSSLFCCFLALPFHLLRHDNARVLL